MSEDHERREGVESKMTRAGDGYKGSRGETRPRLRRERAAEAETRARRGDGEATSKQGDEARRG